MVKGKMSNKTTIRERATAASAASLRLAAIKSDAKNAALTEIAKALDLRRSEIVVSRAK